MKTLTLILFFIAFIWLLYVGNYFFKFVKVLIEKEHAEIKDANPLKGGRIIGMLERVLAVSRINFTAKS